MSPRITLCALVFLAGCRTTASGVPGEAGPSSPAPGSVGDTPHPGPSASAAAAVVKVGADPGGVGDGTPLTPKPGHALAEFAAGCFWGVEDGFRKVKGVTATAVGYTGGTTDHPTYGAVCNHGTGHAEAVLVEFDPTIASYDKLLRVFLAIHDPTQMNRQGPDRGDQYRSAIFTFSPDQDRAARAAIEADQAKQGRKIVTQVTAAGPFWKAEDYHQQYAEKTGHHGCPTGRIDDAI